MAIQHSISKGVKTNVYTCGCCGYKFLPTELEIEVSTPDVLIMGEVDSFPKKKSIIRCPNCNCDVGRLKVR